MKTKIKLLLLICSICLKAQNSVRVFYKLDSKPTITKDSLVSDVYLYDTYPKENTSMFYNNVYYNSDSIMTSLNSISNKSGGVNLNFDDLGRPNWNKGILLKNNNIYCIENFDGDSYKYLEENKNIKWNILNETKKCGEYNCQKAITNYKGRIWNAWFTTEIPLTVFPYKFIGLPGLIYEIEDNTSSYHFTFMGLKKINDKQFIPSIFSKAIPTTEKRYLKAYSDFKKDPSKKLKEGKLVTDSGEIMEIFGGFSKNFIDKKTNKIIKNLLNNNNPIELK